MAYATVPERTSSAPPTRSVGPVLVALNPFDSDDSAVVMARWLAERRHASMIVAGTARHGMLDRALYGDSALEVVRRADCTVLVAPAYAEPPITRAIVAVDFSQASLRAALDALEMLDPGSRLTLVHVERAERRVEGKAHRTFEEDERRTRALFTRFLDALPQSGEVQVETVVLCGDAVGGLLRYAEAEEAELIACGRRRHSIADRRLVGSVSTALVRGAPCCVLVAPERPGDDELGLQPACSPPL
jgi:nucleotide-binding universal stress UspA family protein